MLGASSFMPPTGTFNKSCMPAKPLPNDRYDRSSDGRTRRGPDRDTLMHVLIAEDEPRMAELIASALSDDGHTSEIAQTGTGALELARSSPFDLLLLDIMLPEMDGFTVCRSLRLQRLQAPVLMLTALGEIEDRVLGLDAGADDYLVKPFATEELRARVRALGRRPFGLRGPELRVGDLTLNPLRYEAMRAGKRLDLTACEFQLLALLVRHRGEVVSRTQILDAIWGEHAEPFANVVDQYIYYLRSKTEQYGPRLIETVRGAGYIIDDPNDAKRACSEPSA
jgi:DNA-binding response OmpR family regulator